MEIQGHDLKVGAGLAGQMVTIGMPIFVNDDSSWAFRSREFADIPYVCGYSLTTGGIASCKVCRLFSSYAVDKKKAGSFGLVPDNTQN